MLLATRTLDDLDRIFSESLGMVGSLLGRTGGWDPTESPMGAPTDLWRTPAGWVIDIDLPGVDPAEVEVTLDGDTLTVSAQRNRVIPEDGRLVMAGRAVGRFVERITLGGDLDPDRIRAVAANGVLRITVPFTEQARPRRIGVQTAATLAEAAAGGQLPAGADPGTGAHDDGDSGDRDS